MSDEKAKSKLMQEKILKKYLDPTNTNNNLKKSMN
jgi:hypothetical protein